MAIDWNSWTQFHITIESILQIPMHEFLGVELHTLINDLDFSILKEASKDLKRKNKEEASSSSVRVDKKSDEKLKNPEVNPNGDEEQMPIDWNPQRLDSAIQLLKCFGEQVLGIPSEGEESIVVGDENEIVGKYQSAYVSRLEELMKMKEGAAPGSSCQNVKNQEEEKRSENVEENRKDKEERREEEAGVSVIIVEKQSGNVSLSLREIMKIQEEERRRANGKSFEEGVSVVKIVKKQSENVSGSSSGVENREEKTESDNWNSQRLLEFLIEHHSVETIVDLFEEQLQVVGDGSGVERCRVQEMVDGYLSAFVSRLKKFKIFEEASTHDENCKENTDEEQQEVTESVKNQEEERKTENVSGSCSGVRNEGEEESCENVENGVGNVNGEQEVNANAQNQEQQQQQPRMPANVNVNVNVNVNGNGNEEGDGLFALLVDIGVSGKKRIKTPYNRRKQK